MNDFIQIQDNRFKKNEMYHYSTLKNYKRIYIYLKHYNGHFNFDFKTDEEFNEQVSKLDSIFLNSDISNHPIKESIIDFFVDTYSDMRNDGRLLGNSDIIEKLNNSDKMNETVQKIKDIFNGKSNR